MRFAQLRDYDVANGPGIRTTIFVTGCTIGCKNCFNPEYQNFEFGNLWTDEVTEKILKNLEKEEVEGLTILGGEPFDNAHELCEKVEYIRANTHKSIWIFSGYVYEKLIKNRDSKKILENCDVLVDGPFIEDLKDLKLKFRGSSNQRLIDLKKTLKANEVIEIKI